MAKELTQAQAAIKAGDEVFVINSQVGRVVQVVRNDDGTRGAYVRIAGQAKAWKYRLETLRPVSRGTPGPAVAPLAPGDLGDGHGE